ncbi:hypothetical protein [Streptomyces sp. NPDC101145]|uniref:hypothetical protein n=1 Tax=Streptomyces sp. NPDC101145 TaxID=3366112 RepID=UPI00381F0976
MAILGGVAVLVIGGTATASAGVAAERNYQVIVCAQNSHYTKANVGGYNQHNDYVHTPNFALTQWDLSIVCGYQKSWWFKATGTVQINYYDSASSAENKWKRVYRKLSNCPITDPDKRLCTIDY